jgi:hypothetical protein
MLLKYSNELKKIYNAYEKKISQQTTHPKFDINNFFFFFVVAKWNLTH